MTAQRKLADRSGVKDNDGRFPPEADAHFDEVTVEQMDEMTRRIGIDFSDVVWRVIDGPRLAY